jgi:hypothetical protein
MGYVFYAFLLAGIFGNCTCVFVYSLTYFRKSLAIKMLTAKAVHNAMMID